EAPANAAQFNAHISQVLQGQELAKHLAASQRLAHNIKGSANLLGVKGIANLTHYLEDILEFLTDKQQAPSPALANLLQEAGDCLEHMLEAMQGTVAAPANSRQILQQILDWATYIETGKLDTSTEALPITTFTESTQTPTAIADQSVTPEATPESTAANSLMTATAITETVDKSLRVPTATIDQILQMVGEISIALDQIQERIQLLRNHSNELQIQEEVIQQHRFDLEHFINVRHLTGVQHQRNQVNNFDPLELDYYDELYGTTNSFIESVVDARRIKQRLRADLSSLQHLFSPLQQLKRDLQNTILKVRMESVSTISARLQRSVRQACRATGKQAELEIIGEETKLDSEILTNLADPLMLWAKRWLAAKCLANSWPCNT
ncbi:hypothetical protein TI03_05540, partial [Achromatium sp. WMS1]